MQARTNLTEAAADLAELAVELCARSRDLCPNCRAARGTSSGPGGRCARRGNAVRDYAEWLEATKHEMTAAAGIGKENYSWWMRNVQLSPWAGKKTTRLSRENTIASSRS